MDLKLNNVEAPKHGTKCHHPPLSYLLQLQRGSAFAIHTPPITLSSFPLGDWSPPAPHQRVHGSKAVAKVGWSRWLGTHSVIPLARLHRHPPEWTNCSLLLSRETGTLLGPAGSVASRSTNSKPQEWHCSWSQGTPRLQILICTAILLQ